MPPIRSRLATGLAALACLAPAFASTAKEPPQQLIERTWVDYPDAAGDDRLVNASYDPADIASGVGLTYKLGDAPDVRFDIYVYPLGRVPPDQAVADATREVEGEIRAMEKRGDYTQLRFGTPGPFEVAAPPPFLSDDAHKQAADAASGVHIEASPTADPQTRAIARALDESRPPTRSAGLKRPLSMGAYGKPARSLAYMFYRNLYLISVRATVPESAMQAEPFEAAIDRAVRELVPAITIVNFGDCGAIRISLAASTGDKQKDTLANALELLREMGRLRTENCAAKPGGEVALAKGYERQTLVFPAGTWK